MVFSFFLQKKILLLLLCFDFTSILFFFGICGLLINRRNFLLMLLSLELCFFSSALNFIMSSCLLNVNVGYIYGIFVVLIVVADTSIGLSLIVLVYQKSKMANLLNLINLRN